MLHVVGALSHYYELQHIWETGTNFMTTHYPRYTMIYNTLAKLKPTSCPPDSQCTPCFTTHLANGNQPHVHMPVNIHYELQHIWETGTNFMTTSYPMYTMIYNTFGKLKPTWCPPDSQCTPWFTTHFRTEHNRLTILLTTIQKHAFYTMFGGHQEGASEGIRGHQPLETPWLWGISQNSNLRKPTV